jgi:uncharacterized protein
MRIDARDVAALDRGMALLGSGGGGDTVTGALLLRQRLADGHEITVTPAADLPPHTAVLPIGVVGATAVFAEKLPGGQEFRAALAAIEHWTRRTVDRVMSIEAGGLNGIMPLVVGTDLGLSTVDADLSGRGLPRLNQLSVAVVGRGLAPSVLAEPSGQVLVLAEGSAQDVERAARAFLSTSGGWAALALAPIPAGELPDCALTGTISGALALGRRALAAGQEPDIDRLAELTGGRVLAQGRIIEAAHWAGPAHHGRAGFARGSVTVLDQAGRALLRLELENEYLLALRDGIVVATTPDVLAVLDRRTGVPIPCDAVRRGIEVAVLQLPAPGFWLDRRWLPAVWPRAYGLDADPVLLAGAVP